MTLTSYERESTFKSTVTFQSGSVNVDPSGNLANIKVYQPDGLLYISATGAKDSDGVYHYYISTSTNNPLGIYTIDWYGSFYYDSIFTYMPRHEKESFTLDTVV